MKRFLFLLGAMAPAFLATMPPAAASNDSIVTAVYSEARSDYVRPKLPDGSVKREYYAIANGGYSPGAARDRSIDDVKFPAIAGLVAEFLAQQNYLLANDAKSADLLLVISWGTTITANDPTYRNAQKGMLDSMNHFNTANAAAEAAADAGRGMDIAGIQSPEASLRDAAREQLFGNLYQMRMFEDMRYSADAQNARLLGYTQDLNRRDGPARFAGGGTAYDDLISEVESARYYVIIAAYDFRAATQQRKQKLLWVTRVSIQSQGNKFDRDLEAMLASASHYFGSPSHGLIRRYREGTVNIGELKVIGVEPDARPPARAEEKR